jgi:AcrR family transcriptional regulator
MAGYLLVSNMSTANSKVPESSPFLDEKSCDAGSCARDRIFDAAKKLFYRLGIRGVSVDAIAAEADTTKVTFYRVFDSKEDLVVKVLEEQSQRFWKWWDEIVAKHENPAREVIRAHRAELAKRLRDLCHAMQARQPDVLGDALSLLLNGMFSSRIDNDAPEQFESVYDAAKALIESPALGVAPKNKR